MKRHLARALAAQITQLIDAHVQGKSPVTVSARSRLTARATRHLPAPGAPEGSPLWPPAYALRISEALGLDPSVSLEFAAAGALFFAAADLADDIADGDVLDVANGVNDVCRLLMMTQGALLNLVGVPPAVRTDLALMFVTEGQRMAEGQECDLRGTNAEHSADPVEIAALKSGGEFALFTAGPALLAGRPPAPFAAFGRAFGCLGQTLSDAFDLFLDPDGDDWVARKPTFALRHALAEGDAADALRALAAGANHRPDRKGAALWQMVHLGAGRRLEEIRARCVAQMTAATASAGHPPVLTALCDELTEWTAGVCEALDVFAGEPEPKGASIAEDLPRARRALSAFIDDWGSGKRAERQLRWGFLETREVADPRLEPLVITELRAHGPGVEHSAAIALVEALPSEGWPRFDHPLAAVCIDTTARAIRLAARLGRNTDKQIVDAGRVLVAGQRRNGLFPPWLGSKRDPRRKTFAARFGEETCPAQSAWAALALWSLSPGASPPAIKAAVALSELFSSDTTPASPFYGALTVDTAGARALKAIRSALSSKARKAADEALAAIIRRTRDRQRLDGLMGDVLETAQGAWTLSHLGAMTKAAPTVRALLDAQALDGGYPACPFRREWGPGGERRWWGSRALTSAFVERCLETLTP